MQLKWFLVLFTINLHAQNKISGVLKYSQITAFEDTTRRNLIPVSLCFNQYESITANGILQKMNSQDSSRILPPVEQKKRYSIYVNLSKREMRSRERADRELVIIKDTLENIDWEILPQKRLIGNIKCQLAKAMVRGRKYSAWFAPEIPLSLGPWKLQGLPGLILAAKSEDNQVEFRFEALVMPDPNKTTIEPLEPLLKMKTLNQSEFLKLRKTNDENFMKMMEAQPDFEKGSVTFKSKWIEIFPEK